jgi:hypothetical protein
MNDDKLRHALQAALDEEARGDYAPLDFAAIRREGAKLLERASSPALREDRRRKLLAEADEDIARGDVSEWNVDEIKADARRLFTERRAQRDC